MREGFDRWLEAELGEKLGPFSRVRADPGAARYRALRESRSPAVRLRRLLASTGGRLAVSGAVAASAIGLAIASASLHSGSGGPGPTLASQMQDCQSSSNPAECASSSVRAAGGSVDQLLNRGAGAPSPTAKPPQDAGRTGPAGGALGSPGSGGGVSVPGYATPPDLSGAAPNLPVPLPPPRGVPPTPSTCPPAGSPAPAPSAPAGSPPACPAPSPHGAGP